VQKPTEPYSAYQHISTENTEYIEAKLKSIYGESVYKDYCMSQTLLSEQQHSVRDGVVEAQEGSDSGGGTHNSTSKDEHIHVKSSSLPSLAPARKRKKVDQTDN
jgi:hypothetical protein